MGKDQGYQILHNGRDTALEAARFAKSRAMGDLSEPRDCASGEARDTGGRQGRLI